MFKLNNYKQLVYQNLIFDPHKIAIIGRSDGKGGILALDKTSVDICVQENLKFLYL